MNLKGKPLLLSGIILLISIQIVTGQYIKNGYTGKLSYFPGDTAEVFISGFSNFNDAKIYLLDALNRQADSVITDIVSQKSINPIPYQNGFGYSLTFKYVIPEIQSGLYSFDRKVFFIIKSRAEKSMTVVCPTNTIHAYDSSGGKSLYNGNSTNNWRSHIVSFQRPFSPSAINWSFVHCNGILTWLLTQPDIDYQVISDVDMDDYSHIEHSQIVMVIGHSEYWTRKARRNLDAFVNRGGNAMILSGNTMCWQVRYSADMSQMICYRYDVTDAADDSLKTFMWGDPALQYPVAPSIGCDWIHGVMGCERPHGWNGYKITNPESPILAGTGLKKGDTLVCVSSEYDGAPIKGFDGSGYPVIDTGALGFCHVELVGFDFGKSPPTAKDTAYGTFIVFKKNAQSGIVINTAFNEFTANGPGEFVWGESPNPHPTGFGGKDSLKMQRICRNMVDLLLEGRNVFSTVSAGKIIGPDSCQAGAIYTFIDSGATGKVQWQYSQTSAAGPFIDIAEADTDTLFYVFTGSGTYWLRANLTGDDCMNPSSNVVKILVSSPELTEVVNNELSFTANVYPTPAKSKAFLDIKLGNPDNVMIWVYDVQGNMMMESHEGVVKNKTVYLNFENEAAGVYFIKIKAGDEVITRRIIHQ